MVGAPPHAPTLITPLSTSRVFMIQRWRQSLTARMLWLIGAAVGCTILVATALTYALVFRAAEDRDIVHLNEYVAERSQQLERELAATILNLQAARDTYLKRYRAADPPGFMEQWDHYFERGKDGAWLSKRAFSNDYEYATIGESLVQVLLPIDLDGRHLITIGHDLHLSDLVAVNLHSDVLELAHMIVCEDGRIIAHPDLTAKIFEGGGELAMQSSGDPKLASRYQAITGQKEKQISGYDPVGENYLVPHRLAAPGWLNVTTLPRSPLQQQAFQATRWVLWSGMDSLAQELALLGLILRRTVKHPIQELVTATRTVAAGGTVLALPTERSDEIGTLARAFDEMALNIRARDEALRSEKALPELRVTRRTEELAQINQRLADALSVERELSELRANFVSLVSHEFRTPLDVILTSADILDRYLDRLSPEKHATYLRTIHDSIKRMGSMMEDVLLLGRVEEGKLQFRAEPVDLPAFCRRITDEMLSATAHRCVIRFTSRDDLRGAQADESLLRHILANLLSNASKYSPEGAMVDFDLMRTGNHAVFTVRDRGRGIPAADHDKLFQSFCRGSNVSDTPGTGLGLLIVKKCVDIHGGRISFESSPGAGTAFTVSLPLFS